MGSASSKVARTAAGSASRKYPSRIPPISSTSNSSQTASQHKYGAPVLGERQSAPDLTPRESLRSGGEKGELNNIDVTDPVYASHLRTLGVVSSNPFQSNSSTNPLEQQSLPLVSPATEMRPRSMPNSGRPHDPPDIHQAPPLPSMFPHPLNNPAIAMVEARQRLQAQADEEMQSLRKVGFAGRTFLDTGTIQAILSMRDTRGMSEAEIEKVLELRPGTVKRLGPKGLVAALTT